MATWLLERCTKRKYPLSLQNAEAIFNMISGTDFIGIVPDTVFPRYCHGCFPKEYHITDFMNLGSKNTAEIIQNTDWYPMEEIKPADTIQSARKHKCFSYVGIGAEKNMQTFQASGRPAFNFNRHNSGTMAIDPADGWVRSADMTQKINMTMKTKNPQSGEDMEIPMVMNSVIKMTVSKK